MRSVGIIIHNWNLVQTMQIAQLARTQTSVLSPARSDIHDGAVNNTKPALPFSRVFVSTTRPLFDLFDLVQTCCAQALLGRLESVDVGQFGESRPAPDFSPPTITV